LPKHGFLKGGRRKAEKFPGKNLGENFCLRRYWRKMGAQKSQGGEKGWNFKAAS